MVGAFQDSTLSTWYFSSLTKGAWVVASLRPLIILFHIDNLRFEVIGILTLCIIRLA